MEDLKGRRILVTGASTGIGEAAARGFADHGAVVAVHFNRSKKEATALADAIVQVSHFALSAGSALDSVELNPFVVLPEGQGALALDAVLQQRLASPGGSRVQAPADDHQRERQRERLHSSSRR